MQRGTTKEMKTAGEHLVVGHAGLDEMCRKIAPELNIALPNQASPQQQQFVATVDAKSGKEFDSTAVGIMRVTHGQIFPTIAKIRASTQNTLVRQLADLSNDTVLDHITVLEDTGLVNYDQVNFQQTTPPKLPKAELTPPAPLPGSPVVVLTPRPDLDVNTSSRHPLPARPPGKQPSGQRGAGGSPFTIPPQGEGSEEGRMRCGGAGRSVRPRSRTRRRVPQPSRPGHAGARPGRSGLHAARRYPFASHHTTASASPGTLKRSALPGNRQREQTQGRFPCAVQNAERGIAAHIRR